MSSSYPSVVLIKPKAILFIPLFQKTILNSILTPRLQELLLHMLPVHFDFTIALLTSSAHPLKFRYMYTTLILSYVCFLCFKHFLHIQILPLLLLSETT